MLETDQPVSSSSISCFGKSHIKENVCQRAQSYPSNHCPDVISTEPIGQGITRRSEWQLVNYAGPSLAIIKFIISTCITIGATIIDSYFYPKCLVIAIKSCPIQELAYQLFTECPELVALTVPTGIAAYIITIVSNSKSCTRN